MLEFILPPPRSADSGRGAREVGGCGNVYLMFLDASREAARFGANIAPELTSKHPFDMRDGFPAVPDVAALEPEELRTIRRSGETTDFYYEVACLVFETMPTRTDAACRRGGLSKYRMGIRTVSWSMKTIRSAHMCGSTRLRPVA